MTVHRYTFQLMFMVLLSGSVAPAQVVINEVLYRVDASNSDPLRSQQWVELFNKGAAGVDLTGWKVAGGGGAAASSARALPAMTLAPGAYFVVHFGTGSNGPSDYYTQDTAAVLSPAMDGLALYSTSKIVDFISWSSAQVPYVPGTAHNDAVAAKIWTAGASLASDAVQAAYYEMPRAVLAGMSIGRDPTSTDTDTTVDFEPHGGVGAMDNTPNAQNLSHVNLASTATPATAFRPQAAPAQKSWTVMLYINGDNNVEAYFLDYMKQIAAAGGSDDNINFVVQFDGMLMAPSTYRGIIGQGSAAGLPSLPDIGERNMGSADELAEFVQWAKTNYPANRYALILAAHGDGWKSFGPDVTSNSDFLYMNEFTTALSGQSFDLVAFNACMMAGIEVAEQFRGIASYFLASQEVMPSTGLPYSTFVPMLKSNPNWTAVDLGKNIVNLYAQQYPGQTTLRSPIGNVSIGATLSLLDESMLSQLITQMDTWSQLLITGSGLFQSRDNPADNVQVRIKFDLQSPRSFFDANFVDLYGLASAINADAGIPDCTKTPVPMILNQFQKLVVASYDGEPPSLAGHGLSIYFPRFRKSNPESVFDYDSPFTRLESPYTHYGVYFINHDLLPLMARDREDGSNLNPRNQWPEPPSPQLMFAQETHWPEFLERYYHPVADNHILRAVSPLGVVIYPATTALAGCTNPSDSIVVPTLSTVYLSGVGSSDADEPDTLTLSAITIANIYPNYYFWDLNGAVGCTSNCIAPSQVPAAADAAAVATTFLDEDRMGAETTYDQKDAVGQTASFVCPKAGIYQLTLHVFDDNHLKVFHDTNPNALYVHPQTDSNQSEVICVDPPDTVTTTGMIPSTATLQMNFTVMSDPFTSAPYVGLTQGNATATFSGLGMTPAGQIRGAAATTGPQISLVGDRPQLVPVTGPYDTVKNAFNLQGTSTSPVAGFSNVQAQYTLTLGGTNFDTITGTYQVGLNNTLNGEAQPVVYSVTGTITNKKYPVTAPVPTITAVNTSGAGAAIAQNGWIEIHGTNLVPATTPAAGVIWSNAPDFATGHLPTTLSGVSVTVNGKPAFVYFYCSAATSKTCATDQINVLTPLDTATGQVAVVATSTTSSGAASTAPFMVTMQTAAPSFLLLNANGYVVATHADNSLVGPTSLYPGYSTPAAPGELLVLYAVGFGLPANTLTNGSSSQSGTLAALPVCTVGGEATTVAFAGLIGPGLYQLNLTMPSAAVSSEITCSYKGFSTPTGDLMTIQP